jgi:transposase
MNSTAPQVGIDVSKDELFASVDEGKPKRFSNCESGCDSLKDFLPEGSVIHVEATGGYERLVCRQLRKGGFKVHVHNPYKAKRMAQGIGKKAKTDPVDAIGLSTHGHLLPDQEPKSPLREDLTDISRTIDSLKSVIADLKKQVQKPLLDQDAKAALEASAKDLAKRIAALEKRFLVRVKASETISLQLELARSVPTIGPAAARACVCELPQDLTERTAAQISSYAGLAPIDDTSGKKAKPARIGRGNLHLKGAFYMPAMCAISRYAWAKDIYARLRAKGRTHQQAIVAVMRRLLVRVVSVLKRGTPWKDEDPTRAKPMTPA